jgi:hypothetical protein
MAQIVTKTRIALDKEWRAHPEDASTTVTIDGNTEAATGQDVSVMNQIPSPVAASATNDVPTTHLPVNVTIVSLADWTVIKRKLESAPNVVRVNVLSLQRGTTAIDLEYRGTLQNLQQSISQSGMVLMLDPTTQTWTLKRSF